MSLLTFIHDQKFRTLPIPTKSCEGKTVIVTGSNVGLGFEAARRFVRLKAAKVILAVRSVAKGEAAKADIDASTKCAAGTVQVWELDLQSYASVKAFAARAAKDLERLDVLLENAGIATAEYRIAEGGESTITTNVTSTFLLGMLMLPQLKETAKKHYPDTEHGWEKPVLTIVSSEVHERARFKEGKDALKDGSAGQQGGIFRRLNTKETSGMWDRYNVSKLLEVFFVRELAGRRPDCPVTINYVNPGLCHSELAREIVFVRVLKVFLARSTEEGSRTLVHAAAEAGPESHGCYLTNCEIHEPSAFVRSEQGQKLQKLVWEELSAILEKQQPGVMSNL